MQGVEVQIAARFVEGRSRPADSLYIWAYEVTVRLQPGFKGELQLVGRYWAFRGEDDPQITDADTVMGEHPVLSWDGQPLFRYRSVVALPVSGGTMQGHLKARHDCAPRILPVPLIVLDQANPITLPPTDLSQPIAHADQFALVGMLTAYTDQVAAHGKAWLSTAYFPASIRARMEDWILQHREYNEKKTGEHDFVFAGDIDELDVSLPTLPTRDIYANITYDAIEIVFLYGPMSTESLSRELHAVLNRHGVAPVERRDALVDDLCAKIDPLPPIPDKAPKLYADRPKGQTIIDFLRDPDGWGPYVKSGKLSRVELGRLDHKAYKALDSWLQRNTLPPDIVIPTKSQVIERMATQFLGAVAADRPAKVVWTQTRRRKASMPP